MDDSELGNIEALYRLMGFRVPLEGVPDDQQKCQVLSCSGMASRTLFFQHKQAPQDLRLWLCESCASKIMGPKPVGVRALVPEMHLESIPMEHRDKMKDALAGQIEGYLLEQFLRPKGEIRWAWNWVDYQDQESGKRIYGTELLGEVAVERVEIHAPSSHS